MQRKPAFLVLENGIVFTGKSFGSVRNSHGEVVFQTGMTGYQEVLTDPTNCGQIVTMTYPLIGNYGFNRDDFESLAPVIQGVVVKEASNYPSNWRAENSLDSFLKEYDLPGIYDLDTRRLTRILREEGSMKGMLITEEDPDLEQVKGQLSMIAAPKELVAQVSAKSPYHLPGDGYRVAVVDFGIKASILRELTKRNCDILVLPYHAPAEEIIRWRPDGVLLSNGPGNPHDLPEVKQMIKNILGKIPLFGIGLGHQLLSLACGAQIEKMKFGHRGSNYPVRNVHKNKTVMTTQNHAYTILAESIANTELEATYININDQSIEGIQHKHYPAFSVQFQPEASTDLEGELSLFDQFIQVMKAHLGEGVVRDAAQ